MPHVVIAPVIVMMIDVVVVIISAAGDRIRMCQARTENADAPWVFLSVDQLIAGHSSLLRLLARQFVGDIPPALVAGVVGRHDPHAAPMIDVDDM
jgi:hypothetical protein